MKSNYEVIKIKGKNPYCDGKINPYVEACDKVLLNNTLKFPCDKKDIKSVKKIYISVNIDSIKIIDVPITNVLSEDMSELKEKKLYVIGSIIEKIEYITTNCYKKEDTLTIKSSFSKYIGIQCNYIEGINDYCVIPFIKNICVEVTNKRCIKQKIELILSAHKKEQPIMESNINSNLNLNTTLSTNTLLNNNNVLNDNKRYTNIIDFYGEDDLEIAKVELDINNKSFKATSNNNIANFNFDGEKYFEILLKDSEGNIKLQAIVMGHETAESFAAILNNSKFNYNDILQLNYEENNRIEITNLPEDGYIGYVPKGNSESFVITPKGLIFIEEIESKILNSIIIKGKNSEFMAQINIINDINNLQVVSSSKIINDDFSEEEYFAILFNDINGNLKKEVILKGNENSNKLVEELNDFNFEYDDTIVLRYKQSYNVLVTNFKGQKEYNPTGNSSKYIITPDGLASYEAIESTLLNSIILNGRNLESIVKIDLVEDTNKIMVISSGLLTNNNNSGSEEYFSLALKDSTENLKIEVKIKAGENANNFAIDLDEFSFDYNDIIELKCSEPRNITIMNYQGQPAYTLIENNEKFAITISGLEKIENIIYY